VLRSSASAQQRGMAARCAASTAVAHTATSVSRISWRTWNVRCRGGRRPPRHRALRTRCSLGESKLTGALRTGPCLDQSPRISSSPPSVPVVRRSLTRRLLAEFARRPPPGDELPAELEVLTARKSEVPALIAAGLSRDRTRAVSGATVKTHGSRLLTKLRIRDRGKQWLLRTTADWSVPAHDGECRLGVSGRALRRSVERNPM
jgi:hypothetical protein